MQFSKYVRRKNQARILPTFPSDLPFDILRFFCHLPLFFIAKSILIAAISFATRNNRIVV
jgi:hypothetical protein